MSVLFLVVFRYFVKTVLYRVFEKRHISKQIYSVKETRPLIHLYNKKCRIPFVAKYVHLKKGKKYFALLKVISKNGVTIEEGRNRIAFEHFTSLFST